MTRRTTSAWRRSSLIRADAEWSVLVPKSQWKKTDPVRLVAADRTLEIDLDHK
ncbi:hypothetical protein [Paraburkholderia tuberum]|uniref:hypothetical protein n=1 Tax=Paraburkholderia tuberum TaxID=157910 RepID=UPI000A75412E|nr:hypothetical protein [Paraburkholderia tuberum]